MPLSAASARTGWSRGSSKAAVTCPCSAPWRTSADVAARAERQREGVEQDRLAGAGLAGQHGKPVGEIDVEPIDQDDVADRKPGEHGLGGPDRAGIPSGGFAIIEDDNESQPGCVRVLRF